MVQIGEELLEEISEESVQFHEIVAAITYEIMKIGCTCLTSRAVNTESIMIDGEFSHGPFSDVYFHCEYNGESIRFECWGYEKTHTATFMPSEETERTFSDVLLSALSTLKEKEEGEFQTVELRIETDLLQELTNLAQTKGIPVENLIQSVLTEYRNTWESS